MLTLPEPVQEMVERGILSPGHARALLALGEIHSPIGVANDAVAMGFSVRRWSSTLGNYLPTGLPAPRRSATISRAVPRPSTSNDPAGRRIEDDLRRYLQTDVKLKLSGATQGKLEIAFYSNDDLERVLDLILRDQRKDF